MGDVGGRGLDEGCIAAMYRDQLKCMRGEALDSDTDVRCMECREQARTEAARNASLVALRGSVPHVGELYGQVGLPRVVLVGLEDPYHPDAVPEAPTSYLEAKEARDHSYFFKRHGDIKRNPHRAGEWVFAKAALALLCPGMPVDNPFKYIATLNGHLCGLKKGDTGTASVRLGHCPVAWRLVAALKPHLVVVEGDQRVQAEWCIRNGLKWECGPVHEVRVVLDGYRKPTATVEMMECKAPGRVVVLFALHPSNRTKPWCSNGKSHPYVHHVLLGPAVQAALGALEIARK